SSAVIDFANSLPDGESAGREGRGSVWARVLAVRIAMPMARQQSARISLRYGLIFAREQGGRLADCVAGNQSAPFRQRKFVGRVGKIQLSVNFPRCVRQKRRKQDRKNAASLDKVVEHFIKPFCASRVFGELERRGLIHKLIGAID